MAPLSHVPCYPSAVAPAALVSRALVPPSLLAHAHIAFQPAGPEGSARSLDSRPCPRFFLAPAKPVIIRAPREASRFSEGHRHLPCRLGQITGRSRDSFPSFHHPRPISNSCQVCYQMGFSPSENFSASAQGPLSPKLPPVLDAQSGPLAGLPVSTTDLHKMVLTQQPAGSLKSINGRASPPSFAPRRGPGRLGTCFLDSLCPHRGPSRGASCSCFTNLLSLDTGSTPGPSGQRPPCAPVSHAPGLPGPFPTALYSPVRLRIWGPNCVEPTEPQMSAS